MCSVPVATALPVAVSGFSCIGGTCSLTVASLWGGGTAAFVPQSPPGVPMRTVSYGYQGNCGVPGWEGGGLVEFGQKIQGLQKTDFDRKSRSPTPPPSRSPSCSRSYILKGLVFQFSAIWRFWQFWHFWHFWQSPRGFPFLIVSIMGYSGRSCFQFRRFGKLCALWQSPRGFSLFRSGHSCYQW